MRFRGSGDDVSTFFPSWEASSANERPLLRHKKNDLETKNYWHEHNLVALNLDSGMSVTNLAFEIAIVREIS